MIGFQQLQGKDQGPNRITFQREFLTSFTSHIQTKKIETGEAYMSLKIEGES
jgi:hypothetical protein